MFNKLFHFYPLFNFFVLRCKCNIWSLETYYDYHVTSLGFATYSEIYLRLNLSKAKHCLRKTEKFLSSKFLNISNVSLSKAELYYGPKQFCLRQISLSLYSTNLVKYLVWTTMMNKKWLILFLLFKIIFNTMLY